MNASPPRHLLAMQDEVSRSFMQPTTTEIMGNGADAENETRNEDGDKASQLSKSAFHSTEQQKDSLGSIDQVPAFQTVDLHSDRQDEKELSADMQASQ